MKCQMKSLRAISAPPATVEEHLPEAPSTPRKCTTARLHAFFHVKLLVPSMCWLVTPSPEVNSSKKILMRCRQETHEMMIRNSSASIFFKCISTVHFLLDPLSNLQLLSSTSLRTFSIQYSTTPAPVPNLSSILTRPNLLPQHLIQDSRLHGRR